MYLKVKNVFSRCDNRDYAWCDPILSYQEGPIHIDISPNPTSQLLWIDGIEGKVIFRLYNMKGQEVLVHVLMNDGFIDIRDLPKGMYVLRYLEYSDKIVKL